jgi:FdhD protein
MKHTHYLQITKVSSDKMVSTVSEPLLSESFFRLFVDDKPVQEFSCQPDDLEQLALGYCYCRGLIDSLQDVDKIRVDMKERGLFVERRQSSDGSQASAADESSRLSALSPQNPGYSFEQLLDIWSQFGALTKPIHMTGAGPHFCALSTQDKVVILKSDVGRHNALNKVLGEMLLTEIPSCADVLLLSSRLALDMIERVASRGIRYVMTAGAPTLEAVNSAWEHGITLIALIHNRKINIYSHPERVRLGQPLIKGQREAR